MGTPVVVTFKTLFTILACVMTAALSYGVAMDGFSSCFVNAKWLQVAIADVIIDICLIGAWFAYKESSWILGVLFTCLLFWIGSVGTCGYIAIQFFKLSLEESSKDPLYFVLARHQNRDVMRHMRGISVVTARVLVTVLGCFLLGLTIYALTVDGLPFRAEVLSPCLITALTDISIHVVVFSVWVAYKESSWISAFFWILLLACFSGTATCMYILVQLFYLSPQQPVSLVLFNRNRDLHLSDPLLSEQDNVYM